MLCYKEIWEPLGTIIIFTGLIPITGSNFELKLNPLIHKGLRNNFSFDVFDNNLIVNMRKIAY